MSRPHYRILHVDDSADDAELVRLALEGAPFACSVSRVETEADYVAGLAGEPPDVILCDYNMPLFTAERALAIMNERGLDVPFIVVSNHIGETQAILAMQQGASDYLSKGRLQRLAKAIDAAVDRARSRREKAQAQQALARSEATLRGILDSLPQRIALLDPDGAIVAVNKTWQEFDETRRHVNLGDAARGTNYLGLLERIPCNHGLPAQMLAGIRQVMAGEVPSFSMEYELPVGSGLRWYLMRAFPLEGGQGVIVSHRDITDRMISHIALDDANKRLQALSKRILAVQEEERRAISRELHDDIGQSLAALKIGLHRLSRDAAPGQAEIASECLGIADSVIGKVRRVSHDLRPPQLDQLGLVEALGWLVDRQHAATGARIDLECAGLEAARPSAALESACFRIAQEAMTNAVRHAKAGEIRMKIESDGTLLKLTVRDDGVGFDQESARGTAAKSGSMGLISMEERASLAGGRLRVRSVPGAGTAVTATFPLEQRVKEPAAVQPVSVP